MSRSASRFPMFVGALALGAALVAGSARAEVIGQAYAAYVDLPSQGVSASTFVDTGLLPPTGGDLTNYAPVISLGSAITVLNASSESHGDECRGHSNSLMANGVVLAGTPAEITFTSMNSRDDDECCHHRDISAQIAAIDGLTFGGVNIDVTGEQNQIVDVPGVGRLIINELHHHPHGDDCEDVDYTLNALHLILANGEDVVLGSSRFDSRDHCCPTGAHKSTWGGVKARYR